MHRVRCHVLLHASLVYLEEQADALKNEVTLKALKIGYDHEKLARFGTDDNDGWDDKRYSAPEFYRWGETDAGFADLETLVTGWRTHIVLGDIAGKVLCEYLDSRLHCFDNKQEYGPSGSKLRATREEVSSLASWQAGLLKPTNEIHAVMTLLPATHDARQEVP